MDVKDIQLADLQRIVNMLNKTDGRDKVTKVVQYSSRGLAWANSNNKSVFQLCSSVAKTTADSRKVFRLGKFLNEFLTLHKMLQKNGTKMPQHQMLQFASRGLFALYFLYDNAIILSKMGIFKADAQRITRRAGFLWLVALLVGVWGEYIRYMQAKREYDRLCKENKDGEFKDIDDRIQNAYKEQRNILLNILRNAADIIVAGNMCGVFKLFLGKPLNDGIVGVSGLTSAIIACKQSF